MSNYRRGAHTIYEIKYHLVWMGEVPVSSTDGGGGPSGPRVGSADGSQSERTDREGARQQRPCTRGGVESSDP